MLKVLFFTPTGICLFKDNNRHSRTMCEISSQLTRQWAGTIIVDFEQISHILFHIYGVSIIDFEQLNTSWENAP